MTTNQRQREMAFTKGTFGENTTKWKRLSKRKVCENLSMTISKTISKTIIFLVLIGLLTITSATFGAEKIRVLVFTGGHSFNAADFDQLFAEFPQLAVTKATLPRDRDLLAPGLEKKYDVLVMFDMDQKTASAQQQKNLIDLLNTGIGFFAFHHHLCSQPQWSDYYDLIGGRTFLNYFYKGKEKASWRGNDYEFSTFIDGQNLNVAVADKNHPITRGVKDFQILDEAYGKALVNPGAHVLLTSNHPKQTRQVAWTWQYGNSPIFALFLGHDKKSWTNPDFQKIFIQAIEWLATESRKNRNAEKADWGMKSSPAVVNPAVRSPLAKVLSLKGDWEFKTENAWRFRLGAGDPGWGNRAFDWSGSRTIKVPGNWESQGVGEPGPNVTWDCDWDCVRWDLHHVYMGRALYRKKVVIPANWNGDLVWLKIGGVRSDAWIWVNGHRAGYVNNYCATEKFNITDFVRAGEEVEIIALVRNDVPSRKGLLSVTHHFGGFYRDVELEATPKTYIDDLWIRGQVDTKSAQLNIYLKGIAFNEVALKENEKVNHNTRSNSNSSVAPIGSVDIVIKTKEGVKVATASASFDRSLPLDALASSEGARRLTVDCPIPNCRFWTPEDPYLYYADIVLKNAEGKVTQGWADRFGVRKLEVRGDRFYLNGRPYYFRGGGDHNYDSLTITEYPNRERFLAHQKIYKAAGFNYMRHHTHAPLPEYFEAADESGILLQPELPYYHDVTTEGFSFDPMRDMIELFKNYRRYTSFATYSYGNEGYLGRPIDVKLYQWVKRNDPDRLVLHQDGGRNLPDNSDFTTGVPQNFCSSLIKPWKSGLCDELTVPVVTHEYLNLAIKMDPHLEPKFTGVRVSPISMEKYRALLKEAGLTETWGEACLRAAEGLQAIYQKEGIEFARSEAVCDGHIFWSLVDASIPQGSTVAAQGYLDTFWNVRKNGNKPETFYQFNGPTALLLKTDPETPIAVSGDKITAEFRISHYNAQDIPAGFCDWRLVDTGNKILASGALPFETIKTGFAGLLGKFELAVPEVTVPIRARFELSIRGSKLFNDWNYWIFPKRGKKDLSGFVISAELIPFFSKNFTGVVQYGAPEMKSTDILITGRETDDMFQAIHEGRSAIILSSASQQQNVRLGWWGIGTQVGTAFADHPVYGDFPKSGWMDQLWFRLIRAGAPDLRAGATLGRWEPLAVGEGRDSYYLYLGQGKLGSSRLLASFAIDLTQELPEALSLLDNVIHYAKSAAFEPKKEIGNDFLKESVPDGMIHGYRKIIASTEPVSNWKTYKEDSGIHYNCRQLSKENQLEWLTAPVKKPSDQKVTFIFAGGLGYFSEKSTNGFSFRFNGQDLFSFDLPNENVKSGESVVWKSKDGKAQLKFDVLRKEMPGPDWFGKFCLTVPAELVKANSAQRISVRSLGEGSHRWFAVFPYRDLK